jgi:hypothetical protein
MSSESNKQTPAEMQLEARAEWDKWKISGQIEHYEKAIDSAHAAGFGNDGKTEYLKNVPELSDAYDGGVIDHATEFAVEQRMARVSPHDMAKYGPEVPPVEGRTYEGPIVHADERYIYQAVEDGTEKTLVTHTREVLNNAHTGALAQQGTHARIRYVTADYAVASSVSKDITGPAKEMGREK